MKQLLSQNEIARRLGVSKSSLSKWLKRNAVSPKQLKGQQKLYEETVIDQYKKEIRIKERGSNSLKPTFLLQEELKEKRQETVRLQQRIKDLEMKLEEKDEEIEKKDKIIADFGSRFADLAEKAQSLTDQSQKLNLIDKPAKNKLAGSNVEEDSEYMYAMPVKAQQKKKHWWNRVFKGDNDEV
jgi:transcriptional regulator with XRE-family HTH domain